MHDHDMQAMNAWDWVWMTPTVLVWVVPGVLAVYLAAAVARGDSFSRDERWRRIGRFMCHGLGMTVAMMLGMAVLATTFTWYERTELAVLAMAAGMTLPMTALMRYGGHGWKHSGEMATAMALPAVALLAALWFDVMAAHLVLPLQMVLMLPAMVAVMVYRVDQFTAHPCTIRPTPRS